MNNAILILGESGTGKSSSMRTLPPEETFVINVIGKSLPFRGSRKSYKPLSSDGLTGNYYATDNHTAIMRVINLVNNKRPEIKYLVIDDFGFTLSNDFMRKALQKGYDKYSELAKDVFEVIDAITTLRPDLFCFVIMHSEVDSQGTYKPKTIGKMIDQYVCIEGKFTYVLYAMVSDGNYKFISNSDGVHICKTPMGLFQDQYIDNDLKMVSDKISEYLNEDINV